jgi:hypothetical protein
MIGNAPNHIFYLGVPMGQNFLRIVDIASVWGVLEGQSPAFGYSGRPLALLGDLRIRE